MITAEHTDNIGVIVLRASPTRRISASHITQYSFAMPMPTKATKDVT